MPALPTGMVRHDNGRYYLRRRIPQDLISSYKGKKEILLSLKTSNYRDAFERFRLADAKLVGEWDHKRQRLADFLAASHVEAAKVIQDLTQEEIDRICKHFEAASLAGDEQRREDGHYEPDDITYYQDAYREGIAALKAAVAIGDIQTLGPILKQFLDIYQYRLEVSDSDYRRLAIAIGRTAIRTNENLLRRYEGEDVPTPTLDSVEQNHLSEVIQDYLDTYPAKKQAAMYKKITGVLPMFLEVVGDKPLCQLRQTDINQFFDLVQTLPPRWKDIVRQRKMTVRQVAELGLGEMSPGTFDGTYKAAITPFLKWAYTNWQDRGFPTTLTTQMITYRGDRVEGEAHQRAFTTEELSKLFSSPQIAAFAKDQDNLHKYWLPHLGLFTGARINELCQLNPQIDVRPDEKTGIWFLDITEDSEADEKIIKAVKTAPSRRKVPIHSQLIKLGFLDYVNYVKERGDKLLFAKFPPSSGRASAKARKWFGEFLVETDLRDDTPGAKITGMHAFRSTFLSRAMNLKVVNAEAITGHAQNVTILSTVQDGMVGGQVSKVVQRYQGELELQNKRKILEHISWPELKFIMPHKPS